MPITIQTVSEVPEIIICSSHKSKELMFFPVNMRVRPLTRLHKISTARDWFQILLCPNHMHICSLGDGTFFKFPQSILTADLVHMAFSTNSMSSKHLIYNHNVPEFQGGFLSGQNFQNFDFWGAQNFSQTFFSLRSVPVLPVAWPGGCGSRGDTPLHLAARNGHDSVVQRLLEARRPWMRRTYIAVASKEDIGGETSWCLGIPLWSAWRCWWFTDGSTFGGMLFYLFGKACQNICTNVWCCCVWTQLYYTNILFLHFGLESPLNQGFSLEIEWPAHHNPNCFWGSRDYYLQFS